MKDFIKLIFGTALAVTTFAVVLTTYFGIVLYTKTRYFLESSHCRE